MSFGAGGEEGVEGFGGVDVRGFGNASTTRDSFRILPAMAAMMLPV